MSVDSMKSTCHFKVGVSSNEMGSFCIVLVCVKIHNTKGWLVIHIFCSLPHESNSKFFWVGNENSQERVFSTIHHLARVSNKCDANEIFHAVL